MAIKNFITVNRHICLFTGNSQLFRDKQGILLKLSLLKRFSEMAGPQKTLITAQQLEDLKMQFLVKGIAVSDWARQNNFPQGLVYSVINGQVKARRGKAHAIAVQLGLIPQVDVEVTQLIKEEA
jgi:gp16 family phage-associated protein